MSGEKFTRVPLEPGRSLNHWIEHAQRAQSQNGSNAQKAQVTEEMMKRHCEEDDLWIILHGKVYNVSEYVPFHPGGKDSLMSVAGGDATSLFNEYHPWVNFDSMLPGCCVGVYVGNRNVS